MRHYPPRKPRTGNTSWNHTRDRATQARFRQMLLDRDGHTCQGCGATDIPLQAHHASDTDGELRCDPCHREVDDHAR